MKLAKDFLNRYTIVIISSIFYIFLVCIFYFQTKDYTINKAQERIEDLLLNVQALRSFNSNFQKEEVYKLQQNGFIYNGYFSPTLLSSTYVSKEVNKIYNELRIAQGKEPIVIRFASSNPRNPQNQATAKEDKILEDFNKKTITEYREIITTSSGEAIYYAVPTKVTTAECVKCHSDPSLAPSDLVKYYGDQAGFYEHNGEVRALLSTVYPINAEIKEGMFYFYILTLSTLVVFLIIGFVSHNFLDVIDEKQEELENINKSLESIVEKHTKEIAQKSEYLNLIFNASPNIILVSDGFNIMFANDTFFTIFSKCDSIDDFSKYYDSFGEFILNHESKVEGLEFDISNYIDKNKKLQYSINNKLYYFNMTTTKISFNDKVLYLHILADITELETTKKTLEVLSIKDELTSLYNRRYFNTVYDKELNRAIRSGEYIAFAVLDIDYFKNYNDSMGHIKGDEALVKISSVMSSLFHRSGDYVFRMGGEEFCIIMIGVQPHNALQYLHKLRDEIENLHIHHPDSSVSKYITVSTGLYVSKVSNDVNVDYYKEADTLLYEAKVTRNCVVSNVEFDSTVD